MARGFKGQGAYSTDRGDASAFKPDTSFFKNPRRAGEGETAGQQGKLDGFTGTFSGFGKDTTKAPDPNLKSSQGNSGFQGGKNEGK
jgi:hypothetical protein